MKIALLQLNLIVGDIEGNARKIEQAAQQAQAQGSQLAVTSELALLGYPPRDLLLYPALIQRAGQMLRQLADRLQDIIPVVVGTAIPTGMGQGRPLYNSAAWLEGGEIRHWIHKTLLPTYDVFDEDRYFEPSGGHAKPEQPVVIPFGSHRIGFSICEDIWNDQDFWHHRRYHTDPVAAMAKAGATVLVNLSASPFSVGKQALRQRMLAAMSRRHQIPVVYVNQVGGNDDLIFDGGSLAIAPSGELLAQGSAFEPDVVPVNLDTLNLAGIPISQPKEVVQKSPQKPDQRDPMAELYQALVLGTRDYAHKCGFETALLGLSGGIDSAVTAVIAAAALGSERVLGVLMPSPYSSQSSLTDAYQLAHNLGLETLKLPIQPVMAAFEQLLAAPFANRDPDITEENLQSRIRGTTLMALSNKFGRLLLTTGNKSELAVGYCTIYGDMSGGLAVISDLPKTQVYALARWINRQRQIIPSSTLTKPPSAELRPDQQDSDSLPPYEVLDAILEQHIQQHYSEPDLVTAGWDPVLVARIVKLVKRAEFKRKQAPPGLRVTDRAFGSGWRMPIARH